jgi:glycine/serine hydroxymethyltransferase
MYTNIPKTEIAKIVRNVIENHGIDKNTKKEIMQRLGIILEQNNFQTDQEYYKQTDGLAMGAPTSSVLAEIYI